jgi:hypothetical protein
MVRVQKQNGVRQSTQTIESALDRGNVSFFLCGRRGARVKI